MVTRGGLLLELGVVRTFKTEKGDLAETETSLAGPKVERR
jgi:hypothetical protein